MNTILEQACVNEPVSEESLTNVAKAAQRALISSIRATLVHVRKDNKAPGLTWDQIEYILEEYSAKSPLVIVRKGEPDA